MSASLLAKRNVQHDSIHHQEAAHAQEECSLGAIFAEKATHQESDRQQAEEQEPRMERPQLHGLPGCLPPRGHVDLRQFYRQGQRANLYEVEESQPLQPAVRIAHTQEECHHCGHNPEENKEVAGPQCTQRRVLIVVAIGVETLSDGGKERGERHQAPDSLAKWTRALRHQPANHRRGEGCNGVDPVSPNRCALGAVLRQQYAGMHTDQDSSNGPRRRAKSRHPKHLPGEALPLSATAHSVRS